MESIVSEVQQLESISLKPGSPKLQAAASSEAQILPLASVIADILARMGQLEQETSVRQARMQEIYDCVQELSAQIEKLEAGVL